VVVVGLVVVGLVVVGLVVVGLVVVGLVVVELVVVEVAGLAEAGAASITRPGAAAASTTKENAPRVRRRPLPRRLEVGSGSAVVALGTGTGEAAFASRQGPRSGAVLSAR
jgi:hypothetical protein